MFSSLCSFTESMNWRMCFTRSTALGCRIFLTNSWNWIFVDGLACGAVSSALVDGSDLLVVISNSAAVCVCFMIGSAKGDGGIDVVV